jgi:hypothetical protein
VGSGLLGSWWTGESPDSGTLEVSPIAPFSVNCNIMFERRLEGSFP